MISGKNLLGRVYTKYNGWKGVGFNMDASRTFRIIGACGVVGVLVDFDHIIAWAVRYISNGETIYSTRFLHTPLLIWAGTLIIIMCAYLGGLYSKYLLRNKSDGEL